MFRKPLTYMFLCLTLASIFGCGSDDSNTTNTINLPTDMLLSLYCDDVGIYTEKCVLDDPANPYRMVIITEENKWALHTAAPSAKARFYLWATALAHTSTGENQYYVASSLHQLYTDGTSSNAKAQAKRAYRSVLDNFYNSLTYWEASWLPGTPTPVYAVPLKDLTGMRLYDPTPDGLSPLYSDPYYALNDLAIWGYSYNTALNPITGTGILSK